MSLLKGDAKLVKEFGIVDELSAKEKKEYVQEQIHGINKMIWRLRVDTIINSALEPDTETERADRDNKVRSYKNDIRQMTAAVNVLNELKAEL